MSIYFTDLVEITPIIRDSNFRVEEKGTPFNSKAFVEDESEIKYGANGQPIDPNIFIALPKETLITEGDEIKVIKLHGKFLSVINGLIGLWRCDEKKGLVATDSSGYNNHGILEGTVPKWTTGKSGACISFPGTNERLDCGNDAPLNDLGNGDFSISFWMKSKDMVPLNYGGPFQKIIDNDSIRIHSYSTNNQLRVHLSKGGFVATVIFNAAPFDTYWHHIVLIMNRIINKALIYLDSGKDDIELDVSSLPVDISNAASVSWGASDLGANPYEGLIDEMRIYNRVLTEVEIEMLFNYPAGYLQNIIQGRVKKVMEVGSFNMNHIEAFI